MTKTEPRQTALHAEHAKLGASFTDFGGWDMPLKYGSELAEHHAVRQTAGLFDLSHMGEVWITGADAATFLNTALVGNLAAIAIGKAKYTLICNEGGGIIDDLIVYRLEDDRFLVVPNAGNAQQVVAEFQQRASGFDVSVEDATAETSLIAVQGPASEEILLSLSDDESIRKAITSLKYYAWTTVTVAGIEALLARTGYTGEDGFELFVPNERAPELWRALLHAGQPHGLIPAGLAARDSLRLEAGMPLYGNELGLNTTPFEAGLGGIVSFKKAEQFVGRVALEAAKEAGPKRVLVGLKGQGRRAGRSGYAVQVDGEEIGTVTSGLPSPTLGYPVAMAYVAPEYAEPGTAVDVDLRGRPQPFKVVGLPFYKRNA